MLREGCRQSVIILAQEGYRFRWRDVHAIKELADSSRRPGKSSRRPGDLPRRPVDPSTPLWHAFNALHYARLTREAYRTDDKESVLNKFAAFMISLNYLNVHTYESLILRHETAEEERHRAARVACKFAKEFAKKHWRIDDHIRPHEMATMLLKELKDADYRLDNGKHPSLRTIRDWIRGITPRNARKGGRPRKSVLP